MVLRIVVVLLPPHQAPSYHYKKNYDSRLFQSRFKITIKVENLVVVIIIINNNRGEQKNSKIETPRFKIELACPLFKIFRDSVEDTEVFIKDRNGTDNLVQHRHWMHGIHDDVTSTTVSSVTENVRS